MSAYATHTRETDAQAQTVFTFRSRTSEAIMPVVTVTLPPAYPSQSATFSAASASSDATLAQVARQVEEHVRRLLAERSPPPHRLWLIVQHCFHTASQLIKRLRQKHQEQHAAAAAAMQQQQQQQQQPPKQPQPPQPPMLLT